MPKKAVLHVGTAKTGSTAIQTGLRLAAKQNLAHGVSFYDKESVVPIYTERDRLPRAFGNVTRDGAQYHAYKDCLSRNFANFLRNTQAAVISSEELRWLSIDEISHLHADLKAAGYTDIMVVMYVREPSQYYLSMMQQILKASSQIKDPRSFKYPFRDYLENWQYVFGKHVTCRAFDKTSLVEGRVNSDMAKLCSDFFGRDISIPDSSGRVNVSLSAESMSLLQKYRTRFYKHADDVFAADSTELVRILSISSRFIKQNRARLRTNVQNTIRTNHSRDVEWLKLNYDIDFGYNITDYFLADSSTFATIEDIVEYIDSRKTKRIFLFSSIVACPVVVCAVVKRQYKKAKLLHRMLELCFGKLA